MCLSWFRSDTANGAAKETSQEISRRIARKTAASLEYPSLKEPHDQSEHSHANCTQTLDPGSKQTRPTDSTPPSALVDKAAKSEHGDTTLAKIPPLEPEEAPNKASSFADHYPEVLDKDHSNFEDNNTNSFEDHEGALNKDHSNFEDHNKHSTETTESSPETLRDRFFLLTQMSK